MLGEGIAKGFVETARNFFGSYLSKDRLTTVQFPEERLPQIEATRDFPFLVYDGDDWQAGMRCVGCQICEKECPPKCIYIEKSKDKKPDAVGKMQFYPAVFNIDVSVCMSCQICVEVCPFEAIKMDTEFELSTDDRFGGLLWNKARLSKSNEHYRRIHPTDAAVSDATACGGEGEGRKPKRSLRPRQWRVRSLPEQQVQELRRLDDLFIRKFEAKPWVTPRISSL